MGLYSRTVYNTKRVKNVEKIGRKSLSRGILSCQLKNFFRQFESEIINIKFLSHGSRWREYGVKDVLSNRFAVRLDGKMSIIIFAPKLL